MTLPPRIRSTAISCSAAILRSRSSMMSTRLRDGRSFATRRCEAIQHGKVIFSLAASFHNRGTKRGWSTPSRRRTRRRRRICPDESAFVARYGELMPDPVLRYFQRERPIEMRPVDPGALYSRGSQEATRCKRCGFGPPRRLPDDPAIHRAALAYLSDMTLLDTSLIAHGLSVFHPTSSRPASIMRCGCIGRSAPTSGCSMCRTAPTPAAALGFSRGALYSRSGALIASVAQEGLIRVKREQAPKVGPID